MEFLGHISKTISISPHLLCFIFVILADTLFKNEPLDYLLSEVTLQYYATEPRGREIFERNCDTFLQKEKKTSQYMVV